MKWAEKFRDLFTDAVSTPKNIEVEGTPLPPGTEMHECSFCHGAVPTVSFYDHLRYHQKVMHVEGSDE